MESIFLLNALSKIEARVVRQFISAQKIDELSTILSTRLAEECERRLAISTCGRTENEPTRWLS